MAVTLYAVNKGYFDDVEVKPRPGVRRSDDQLSQDQRSRCHEHHGFEQSKDLGADSEKTLAAGIAGVQEHLGLI